jgi:hypothetical protein
LPIDFIGGGMISAGDLGKSEAALYELGPQRSQQWMLHIRKLPVTDTGAMEKFQNFSEKYKTR